MESTNAHSMRWYALHVHPRFEKAVSRNLQARGYEAFLPLARHRRHGTGRVKEITTPLFPGCVFCRFSSVHEPAILEVGGLTGVAGLGTARLPVDERELDNVRTLLDSGLHCQPWPFVTAGEAVSVERGPLSGLEGIVTTVRSEPRLVFPVTVLRRGVAVRIDPDDVRPIPIFPIGTETMSGHGRRDFTRGDSGSEFSSRA